LRAVAGADRRWFWADCRCETERQQRYIHRQAELDAALHAREARAALAESGLEPLDEMTLATFDPRRLRSTDGAHPYQVATRWLADIADLPRARYADPGGPPAALYFYCPGKGRGKTHLAAALAWELCRSERVAFLHEEAYCSRLWSVPFEQREQTSARPGDQAWLTVIDDLGRLEPGKGVRNAWYTIANRRWLRRRWLLLTSNFTLEELVERGTICEATYSRLCQMTRGEYVFFDGEDQRRAAI
jgi:DNA replication protein DnaC